MIEQHEMRDSGVKWPAAEARSHWVLDRREVHWS